MAGRDWLETLLFQMQRPFFFYNFHTSEFDKWEGLKIHQFLTNIGKIRLIPGYASQFI